MSVIEKNAGKKRGLGVVATWSALLKENVKKHRTDEQLLEEMKKEFPARDYFQPVARIRSWFNCGRYGLGWGEDVRLEAGDPRRSVAYGEDGRPKRDAKDAKGEKKSKAKPKKHREIKVVDGDEDEPATLPPEDAEAPADEAVEEEAAAEDAEAEAAGEGDPQPARPAGPLSNRVADVLANYTGEAA